MRTSHILGAVVTALLAAAALTTANIILVSVAVPLGGLAVYYAFRERRLDQFERLRQGADIIFEVIAPAFYDETGQDIEVVLDEIPWPDEGAEPNAVRGFVAKVFPPHARERGVLEDHPQWVAFKGAREAIRGVVESWGWGIRGPELRALIKNDVSIVHDRTLKLFWYIQAAKADRIGRSGRSEHLEALRDLIVEGIGKRERKQLRSPDDA